LLREEDGRDPAQTETADARRRSEIRYGTNPSVVAGLILSDLRARLSPPAFRVLCLDGGGIMGAFTAEVLATFESQTGRAVVDHFDLIAGTSTGGIIAIGLAMGVSAAEISQFYRKEAATIFPPPGKGRGWLRSVRSVFRPKFKADGLKAAIERVIGRKRMRDAQTRLVIPVYDVNVGKVYVFKTPHHPNYMTDADVAAVDVAMATSAAPTYFPAHTIPDVGTYIDGGLWANTPTVVGLVETLDFLGQPPDRVRMLSISTTSYPFRLNNPGKLRGLFGWAPKIIDTFMFGQMQGAENAARCLLRRGLFKRIDFQLPPGDVRMDDALAVDDLIAMGRQIGRLDENLGVVREQFLNGRTVSRYDASPTAGNR